MNAIKALFIILLLAGGDIYGQWTKVSDRLFGAFRKDCCGFGSIFFKNDKLWAGADTLYVSPDHGQTWSFVFAPPTRITEINFFDLNNGVVGTLDGVYKTTNSGLTWKKILSSQNCFGAQFAGSSTCIAVAADQEGFFYTEDGGLTWEQQRAGEHPHFVIGNSDGSAYGFTGSIFPPDGYMYRRSSSGGQWTPTERIDYDCFNAVRHHCSGKIFLMNEEGHIISDSVVSILVSDDEALTWKPIFTRRPPRYFSAGMSISPCCAIYCQTVADGIVRSTDEGKTWKNIGGPSNTIDTRTVCAITDNIIIAIDEEGSVWRTINSGGDPVSLIVDSKMKLETPRSVIDPKPNAQISVPISVTDAFVGMGFSMIVHYDTNSFIYLGSFTKSGDNIDITSQSWPGRALIAFRSSDITADSAVIGYSLFKLKRGELFCDIVHFDSVSGKGTFCVSNITANPSQTIIGNYLGCVSSVAEPIVSGFIVNPNPSEGVFSIHAGREFPHVDIVVLDLLGKVIHERTGALSPDEPMSIDLRGQAAGTYYIRFLYEGTAETIQVVKK